MSRYIDADILSDAVIQSKNNNRHSDTVLRLSHDNEHRHFLAMIDAASTADVSPAPKWISVKERLPEKGTEVLVAGRGPSKTILFIAMYTTYGWDSCDEAFEGYDVTHWMPLPAAPKKGENT